MKMEEYIPPQFWYPPM